MLYSGNTTRHYAEVTWIAEREGGRKNIPFGSRYAPQILVKGETELKWSAFIFNQITFDTYKTFAVVYYVSKKAPDKLDINMEFDIYEGSRKVGSAIIVERFK